MTPAGARVVALSEASDSSRTTSAVVVDWWLCRYAGEFGCFRTEHVEAPQVGQKLKFLFLFSFYLN